MRECGGPALRMKIGLEDDGRVLIYEGHDVAKTPNGPQPKQVDQPDRNPNGSQTQNGLFAEVAKGSQSEF
jgi:hypothetical protein